MFIDNTRRENLLPIVAKAYFSEKIILSYELLIIK